VGFAGRGAGGDLVGDAARRVQIRRVDGASGTADIENDGIGTMTITLHKLTTAKSAIAQMACIRENEAADRLRIGDYAGAEGQWHAADIYWTAALDHLGNDGDKWSFKS
jgi:hypothetical protein